MKQAQLFTLGYEGLDIECFVEQLQIAGVQTVVDVRELPLSRKKGFSKNALRERLEQAGLGYVHVTALGCPKPIRNAYKADSDWSAYTRKFTAYLRTQGDAVRSLWDLTKQRNTCLVCFERDYTTCHRSFVANATKDLGNVTVKHLWV